MSLTKTFLELNCSLRFFLILLPLLLSDIGITLKKKNCLMALPNYFCFLPSSFTDDSHNKSLTHLIPLGYPIFTVLKLTVGKIKSSVQFNSVTQSCLSLCDPMNCSTPGLPVHHQLLLLIKILAQELNL